MTPRMRLLADCGNSTIKLALAHAGGVWLHERLEPAEARLDAFVAEHLPAVSECAALPGAAANTALLERWWARVGAGRPLRLVGRELAVPDLDQYPNCGLDRVIAGLVACTQERRSLVLIDAGTATTFGAWRYQPEAPLPQAIRFEGGLILPGVEACIAALAQRAPALPRPVVLGPDASAVQRDTESAIAAAIGIGYGPMVAACLVKLERETGIREVLLTGGNGGFLITSNVVPRRAYRPSLVLEGIELLCRLAGP